MRHSILFYFAPITLASLPASLYAKEQVSDYRFDKAEVIKLFLNENSALIKALAFK